MRRDQQQEGVGIQEEEDIQEHTGRLTKKVWFSSAFCSTPEMYF